ncbi:hypothetical protein PsorP6_012205 [Peronosclerospora sorghi]|uniref:Uncharacterized protein n=1 Tax=Peronosclerospora sorghi TaxID=230839 RepID=A0ACC0WHQ5_9STRA|nr:hypothetical protein PsorP6_012205 [Peronosclerospora sorghi]
MQRDILNARVLELLELLEVMIRAQEGIVDIAAIRQINWDVHLGDMVTRPMKLGKYNRKLVAKASAAKGRTMNPQLLHRLDDETLKLYKELFANCSVLVGMHPDEATERLLTLP